MKSWLLLFGAILGEVIGTVLLRAAIDHPQLILGVVFSYLAAFALLGRALRSGMRLAIAYGIWGAAGVAVTALLGGLIFGEVLSATSVIGLGMVVAGAFVVETGSIQRARPGPGTTA
ncbi:DMT family transporter [Microlunatus soli]|uniref:Small multidrug resistance pump n=1 Tax=Microlunatus soli TaxID=630515 RepID=A0A1H1TQ03_9ACTN|nr:SMR family transporter [Microlunatus soli]SDS62318.1 small multidrug resistance pump [Microlunatus soli]